MLMEYQCTRAIQKFLLMIYEGDLCIGEIKGDSIQVSDAKKNQYITTLEWDRDKYNTVDKYVHEYLAKNIESECFSPNGSYTVHGYNMLKCTPYSLYTFWKKKKNLADIHQCIHITVMVRNIGQQIFFV